MTRLTGRISSLSMGREIASGIPRRKESAATASASRISVLRLPLSPITSENRGARGRLHSFKQRKFHRHSSRIRMACVLLGVARSDVLDCEDLYDNQECARRSALRRDACDACLLVLIHVGFQHSCELADRIFAGESSKIHLVVLDLRQVGEVDPDFGGDGPLAQSFTCTISTPARPRWKSGTSRVWLASFVRFSRPPGPATARGNPRFWKSSRMNAGKSA
jgi:hypothetical protein